MAFTFRQQAKIINKNDLKVSEMFKWNFTIIIIIKAF